jgi:hypothetical protein
VSPERKGSCRSVFDIFTGVVTEQPTVVLLLKRTLVSWSLAIDECGLGHRSVISYVNERMELYCSSISCLCEPKPFSF